MTNNMLILDSVIAVAPIIAYISQYNLINSQKSTGSFSIDICGVLIMANIMRVFFWFYSGFAINLLIQSLLVISVQFALLQLCVRLGYQDQGKEGAFWRWKNMEGFVTFTAIFTVCLGIVTLILWYFNVPHFGIILGLASLSLEATVGIPQFLQNQRNRSVEGLSMFMIGTWFFGDFSKTIYFVFKAQPFQFILSGAFQLAVDFLILVQVLAFSNQKYSNVKQQYQIECAPGQL